MKPTQPITINLIIEQALTDGSRRLGQSERLASIYLNTALASISKLREVIDSG